MNNHQNRRTQGSSTPKDPRLDPRDSRFDPKYVTARRLYLQKRRKEIRRNRIILLCICILILFLLVFGIVKLVQGLIGADDDGTETNDLTKTSDSQTDMISDDTRRTDTEGNDEPHPSDSGSVPNTEEPPTPIENETPEFTADLADYERYMNPIEERDAYLILVNADNPLRENDTPSDLIDVSGTRKDGRVAQQMRRCAAKALEALFIEATAQGMMSPATPSGYPLSVTSGFRSYATQNYLFNSYVRNELSAHPTWTQSQAEEFVLTYSCRPGTSEHQTGLCCDMHTLPGADKSFAATEQAKWLADNAWKFGFILRFPEDKTDVTGISYEPWHFRYVGRYHAYRIWSQGLCLEEYVAQSNTQ